MFEELITKIESTKETIESLPIKTKANKEKYNEFLLEEKEKATTTINKTINELKRRVREINNSYKESKDLPEEVNLDIDKIKSLEPNITSKEKMNLSNYLYQLEHFYKNDLKIVNEIINKVIEEFKKVGVILTPTDFNHSDTVNKYMNELFNNKDNMEDIFDKIYWSDTELINTIVLNIRYLYHKNKSTIDKYYDKLMKEDNKDNYLNSYYDSLDKITEYIHTSKEYLYYLFINKEYQAVDFTDKADSEMIKSIIGNPDNPDNYDNLIKLGSTLIDYRDYLEFEHLVKDTITLRSKDSEYKNKYNLKLKEISKKESLLFKYNKSINRKLFKLSEKQDKAIRLKRNLVLVDLMNLYHELDDLEIYETTINYVTDETTYLELLKLIAFNFNYLIKLIKDNDILEYDEIIDFEERLFEFIYRKDLNILSNIAILENKNIPYVIRDRFALTNLNIDENKLDADSIGKVIEEIEHIILKYDLKNNNISLDDILFVLKVEKLNLDKRESE